MKTNSLFSFIFIFSLVLLSLSLVSSEEWGYNYLSFDSNSFFSSICSQTGSILQNIDGVWQCSGNNTFNLNGGWEEGGFSVIDGDVYAQTGYFIILLL